MKPKVVEEEKWIEIDGSVQQQWLLAVYFLTFDEERIHSNVTMISVMSLCKYLVRKQGPDHLHSASNLWKDFMLG